jgi:hypothetical protein
MHWIFKKGIYISLLVINPVVSFVVNAQDISLERYLTIECQLCEEKYIVVGQEFSVQISLTEEIKTPKEQIKKGSITKKSQIILSWVNDIAFPNVWEIDVVVYAPAFTLQGTDTRKISLPPKGDSTPAHFRFAPKPIQERKQIHKLSATLYYHDNFIARITQDITISMSLENLKREAAKFKNENESAEIVLEEVLELDNQFRKKQDLE